MILFNNIKKMFLYFKNEIMKKTIRKKLNTIDAEVDILMKEIKRNNRKKRI